MAELGAYDVPVNFDWAGAASLAAALRTTADVLNGQIPSRNTIGNAALEEWRGVFAEQFEKNRMVICASDARALATAMHNAAGLLEQLAEDARAEQARRDAAKEWVARNEAWKAEQASENIAEKVGEGVAGFFGVHVDTQPEPWVQEPIEPNLPSIEAPPLGERGR